MQNNRFSTFKSAGRGVEKGVSMGGISKIVPKNTPLAIDLYLLWKGRRGVLSSPRAGGTGLGSRWPEVHRHITYRMSLWAGQGLAIFRGVGDQALVVLAWV